MKIYYFISILFLLLSVNSCTKNKEGYYPYRFHAQYTGEAPMLPFHTTFSGIAGNNTSIFSPDPLVNYRWSEISETDKLELYELYPVTVETKTPQSFQNIESFTKGNTKVTVVGEGDIMFDFGIESAAWLEFDSPDLSGEVEMSISEYNEPAVLNLHSIHPVKTLKPKKYGNTYRLELNNELHEGVRFGWIHVRKFDYPFTITKVRKVAQVKPVNYDGAFECDNDMLNRIWYTGAYSVRVNMLYDYISPILMERSDRYSWAGDAHLIQAAALVAFGNYPHIRQNLNLNKDKSQGIESYELLWIKSATDYYYHTGDIELFKSHIQPMCDKLDRGYHIFDQPDSILMKYIPGGYYIGWDERLGAGFEYSSNPTNLRHYQFLWIETARIAVRAFRDAGQTELANRYETMTNEKFAQLSQTPAFLDGLDIHAAATAVNTGLLTSAQEQKLLAEHYGKRLQRVSFSPFNTYFIMESMARMGEYGKAFETIFDCWAPEIRYGGTTFFEVFHPSWADALPVNSQPSGTQCGYTSLCHPWSSGITRWMSDEILGITPTSPGYAQTRIQPNSVNLKWIKGNVPTPHGTIAVDFNFEKRKATITIPAGITAKIGYPKCGQEIVSIKENDKTVWKQGDVSDDKYAYIYNVKEGKHSYTIEAKGDLLPVSEAAPIRYAITRSEPEALSWEEGYAKYGKDGIVLFQPEKDIEILPSYIKSIGVCLNNVNLGWDILRVGSDKKVWYKDADGKENMTLIGMLITDNPHATRQTFTVDIPRNNDVTYTLTLYVCDAANIGCDRQGFELFDINTLELLSPLSVVSDFKEGKFISFKIDSDIRLRLYHIRGEQSGINALLFSRQ